MNINKYYLHKLFLFIKCANSEIIVFIIIILLLGLALRLYGLADRGLTFDEFTECYSIRGVDFQKEYSLYRIYRPDHAPLNFFIRFFWIKFFGHSVFIARILGVFCGLISIIISYFVAKQLWGTNSGKWMAFLFSVSPCFIMQSQNARVYPILTMFYLIALYAFFHAIKSMDKKMWIINIIGNIVSIYLHLFYVFSIAIQFAIILLFKKNELSKNFKILFLWFSLHFVCIVFLFLGMMFFIPWDPGPVDDLSTLESRELLRGFLGADLSIWNKFEFTETKNNIQKSVSNVSLVVLYLFYICIIIAFTHYLSKKHNYKYLFTVITLSFLPWVILYLLSILWVNCLAPRFLWPYSTVGLLLMSALVFSKLNRRIIKITLLALLLFAYACQLFIYYPGKSGDGVPGTGRIIKKAYRPGDLVISTHFSQETDHLRYEMNAPDIPLKPAYTIADLCYEIAEEMYYLPDQHLKNSNEGRSIFVVIYPMHQYFNQFSFEEFLKKINVRYTAMYISGDPKCILYIIEKRKLYNERYIDAFIKKFFPINKEIRDWVNYVGKEDIKDTNILGIQSVLIRIFYSSTFNHYDLEKKLVAPFFIGFPLIERNGLEFAKLLAQYLIEEEPASAFNHLFYAVTLFEKNNGSDALDAFYRVQACPEGSLKQYALLLCPLIEALYIHKDMKLAAHEVSKLDGKGVIFPNFLRSRSEQSTKL